MIVECPACESRYDVTGRPPGTRARCRCGQIFLLPEPSQSAKALACPRCGGGVATGQTQCGYCEAALLIKACPRCFARIFHGAKHCDQCGTDVEVPAQANPDGSARQLSCPRCESDPALVARLVGDTLMDECPQCHGLWLDSVAVDRLVRERRQVSTEAVLGMGGPQAGAPLAGQPAGRMYLKCPECATVMNRSNFAKRSGIIVDTCKGHGTWFDFDELPRIVQFVSQGGIEAAQEAALRREQDEIRRKKAALRASAMQQSMTISVRSSRSERRSVSLLSGVLDVLSSID